MQADDCFISFKTQIYANEKFNHSDCSFHDVHLLFIDHYVLVRWSHELISKISETHRWFAIDKQPLVTFDERQLFERAQSALMRGLSYQPVGYYLVSERFTISELQDVYEQVFRQIFR